MPHLSKFHRLTTREGRGAHRPVTSVGHQAGRRVFREGPKFFELCPTVLNDVQHIFPGRAKNFLEWLLSPVPPWWRTWAHKTASRESTKLTNKELSDLWKVPTPEGNSIYGPFAPEELAAGLRRLKLGKSPGLESFLPEFILPAGSALKCWFCDFFTSCMRQLKIPKIWRGALIVAIPKTDKPLGT